MFFQEMIARLTDFWAKQGCAVHQGYDLEVGAGTFNPATFLRCLGPEPYAAVYVEPSRRPQDGRYGENPNRLQFYHQMQVIIKPSPPDLQDLYLQSLEAIGLDLSAHDIRFVHDDWENPTIGAWGLGWEVWIDGMEVTQFTYFQAVGGMPVKPVSGELTYGLERVAMYLQGVDSFFDIRWNETFSYGDLFKRSEWEWSHYNFSEADTAMWLRHFDDFEAESKRLIRNLLPIPAYDFVMKASHAFNMLDARGVISVTERTGYISRIRNLASALAELYVKSREEQAFPLLRAAKASPEISIPEISPDYDAEETQDFLLEVGSEELPDSFVPIGMRNLENAIERLLKQHHLPYQTIETYGTPRRLAVIVRGLRGGTLPQKAERKGPALQAAFESDGNPTKAGGGFFRALDLTPLTLEQVQKGEQPRLEIRKVKGQEYLFAQLEIPGISARQLLAQNLPELILGLDFPKKMRWGDHSIEYARPLRWLVALYGKEEIPFAIGSLVACRRTWGHRQLAPGPMTLTEASTYVETLKKHKVMVDVAERKQTIEAQLAALDDEALVTERVLPHVLHLVEWPTVTVGNFDASYLGAPKEVLISEMVEHQKYFPLGDAKGELVPRFAVVTNTTPTDKIRHGNARALAPRLADGLFLYEEDLKTPLSSFADKLRTITFQKELGSMAGKAERLERYAHVLHSHLQLGELELLTKAAKLCKADLASGLVGEFPELQGTAGGLYARAEGLSEPVAVAIEEHWMPRGERAPLPTSPTGIVLSLCDKIDNFLSCFALGMAPTSSSDPYALRRQAIGMIKILLENALYLPLPTVLSECFDLFLDNPELPRKTASAIGEKKDAILADLMSFLLARFRGLLVDKGYAKDAIEAALVKEVRDLYDTERLLAALTTFRSEAHESFLAVVEIDTRAKKILMSHNPHLIVGWQASKHATLVTDENRLPAPQAALCRDPAEKRLFEHLAKLKEQFHMNLVDRRTPQEHDFLTAFHLLAELKEPVAELFDAVKIFDDDPQLKMNRLALLQQVWDLCAELVDFSKLQEPGV